MSILSLFSKLTESGINVYVADGNLKINAPKGKLTPELLSELKERKAELIQFLEQHVQSEEGFISIPHASPKDYYVLSSAQKRMYILNQMDRGNVVYNLPQVIVLEGDIEKSKLEATFMKLISRHESLRTSFKMVGDEPMQEIHQTADFKIEYNDLSGVMTLADLAQFGGGDSGDLNEMTDIKSEDVKSLAVDKLVQRFIRPFDLSNSPLFRAALIKLKDNEHILMIDMHHIISDGASTGIFVKDFMAYYAGNAVAELPIQYKDFAEWQRSELKAAGIKKQEEFWLNLFSGELPVLSLPTDFARPPIQSFKGSSVAIEVAEPETTRLKKLVADEGATLFIALLAVCNILLSKLSGQDDIIIGTPTAGRKHSDLDELIGMFVNTVVFRNAPQAGKTFVQFMREVKNVTLSAFDNEEYQFEELVEKLNLKRDTGRNPLFDVVFAFGNLSNPTIQIPGLTLKPYYRADESAKFDLHFACSEFDGKIYGGMQYCTSLFKEETARRFTRYFNRIITSVVNDIHIKLEDIDILTEEERQQLVVDFNATGTVYPVDRSLHELFEEQVVKNPGQIAVMIPGKRGNTERNITFSELNDRANMLAEILMEKGITNGSIVGLMAPRSVEAVAAILAVLKSGAAFLPIEPDYPAPRKQFMIEDSGVNVLLTIPELISENTEQSVNIPSDRIVYIDREINEEINQEIKRIPSNPPKKTRSVGKVEDLAYVLYTSGSTGQPKGVMVAHCNVVNYIGFAMKNYVQGESVRFPLFTSLSFDLTITSIFTPLLSGNTVVVYSGSSKESSIENVIEDNLVDVVKLTPSHLKLILSVWGDRIGNGGIETRIKRFIVGGEALETRLAHDIYEKMNRKIDIFNEYGPTEATVGCMIYKYDPSKDTHHTVPIGTPADNAQIYILDKNRKPVPKCVPGEMYISGDGVALGYLNRDELTRERFLDNPFIPGKKMYKSGDLARFLDNGNIEFIGRIDEQVKVRGFRIELGEIENKLKLYRKNKPVHVSMDEDAFGESQGMRKCKTCLLPSNYPGIHFDDEGVCNICREYEKYKAEVDRYFKHDEDFDRIVEEIKTARNNRPAAQDQPYDCLLLFSGGKDSTYVLYRLIDMGLKVLTFTFDNGYISDAAFANINRTTSVLGVKNIVGRAENMNRVFVESLCVNHNVCHGCWNALNTYGVKVAHEHGIKHVVSGLSRGQIFEMRLEGLFEQGIYTEEEIEKNLLIFRKTFHSKNNRFGRILDVELEEEVVEQIQFVDFFRYFNAPVSSIREYLTMKGWVQPVDTGFCSSNCIINDVGIYVFQKERNYHFYAAPLSWDCRLGVISREQGLRETTFEGQLESVGQILNEIGYYDLPVKEVIVMDTEDRTGEKQLCAYIVSNEEFTVSELREYLQTHLPDYMIPAQFILVDQIPLTANGKVDRKALMKLGKQLETGKEYVAPENDVEAKLEALWSELLGIEKVGIHSNFFELGGNSLSLIKMSSSLKEIFGKDISVANLFRLSTIRMLSKYIQEEEAISLQVADEVLDESLNTMDETMNLLGDF